MILHDAALAVDRCAYYGAAIFLFGAGAFLRALAPRRLGDAIAPCLRLPAAAAVVLAVTATAAWLPLEAGAIGGSWRAGFDPSTLEAILFGTSLGPVWMARAGLCVLLVSCLLARPAGWGGLASVSALLLVNLAFSGHAAMDEGARGAFHIANHALHLLAGAAWLGGLVPLLPCLTALRHPWLGRDAARALRRFSAAGHAAVALVLVTGVIDTVLVLGRWPIHWSSPYEALLAAKIGLVGVMISLAVINRYRLTPRIGSEGAAAISAIRRHAMAELALGACVLALVAVFGQLDPT